MAKTGWNRHPIGLSRVFWSTQGKQIADDEGGGFDIGDSEDVDGQTGNLDGNADSAFIQYSHPDGTAVTVDLVMDENPGCRTHGTAVGG